MLFQMILLIINSIIILLFLGGEPVLLSSGIHSFPFKLGLPLGLPSTFLGKHGWVQYFCKVWNYSDLFSRRLILCIKLINLNSIRMRMFNTILLIQAAMREDNGLTHKNQQVFIIMNPIDLNLEPPILAVSMIYDVSLQVLQYIIKPF